MSDEPERPDGADDQAAAAQEWAEEVAMEQERVERAFGRSLFDLCEEQD
jgi:hypothetical protein